MSSVSTLPAESTKITTGDPSRTASGATAGAGRTGASHSRQEVSASSTPSSAFFHTRRPLASSSDVVPPAGFKPATHRFRSRCSKVFLPRKTCQPTTATTSLEPVSPDTVQVGAMLTAFELTAIARPAVRFRGTF